MGQALPLPDRIPVPTGDVLQAMLTCGIILHLVEDEQYIKYDMPDGWAMVDDSTRRDLPLFHIVDDERRKRFTVYGAWKGTYDNELSIGLGDGKIYERDGNICELPANDGVISSETDDIAIVRNFAEALSGTGVDRQRYEPRKKDFETQ